MSAPPVPKLVPGPRSAGLARFVHPGAMLLAAVAAGTLAYRVLGGIAAGGDLGTLTRALPGRLGEMVGHFAGQPLVPALYVALVPLGVWVACGALASALQADDARAQRGQALAWTASACASLAALVTGMTAAKQGMAALGYALAWPALVSVAAVLWASRLPRPLVIGGVTLAALAGLVVRALPVGWPGENSLSWWAMLTALPPAQVLLALVLVGLAGLAAAFAVSATTQRMRWPVGVRLALLTLVPMLLLRALPALEHYGPEKHAAALASEINTSYFQVARGMGARDSLLRGYAARMGTLPMHARTHPPLWPLVFHAALQQGAQPGGERLARLTAQALGARWGDSAALAASVAELRLRRSEVAGLWLVVGLLALSVLLLPAATYFAARAFATPEAGLLAAAWAALLPAPLLYFPDVDVLHPLGYALALGAWLRRERHPAWALVAGAIAAGLVALSFGNLALLLACLAVTLLAMNTEPGRAARETLCLVLLLLPLALLVAWAGRAGAGPLALYGEAMHQHHLILAHRTRFLWLWLNPLECAVAFGLPSVAWLAANVDGRSLWEGGRRAVLQGGELLLAAMLFVLLTLDLSGQTKGESGRLWMGFFPLLLAGAAPALAARERDWPWLALLLAATLVVLKGFYVFVWLYPLR